jgi:hypothetical protein
VKDKVHFHPALCWPELGKDISVTSSIEYVTCPKCVYYYFRPDARLLEQCYENQRAAKDAV